MPDRRGKSGYSRAARHSPTAAFRPASVSQSGQLAEGRKNQETKARVTSYGGGTTIAGPAGPQPQNPNGPSGESSAGGVCFGWGGWKLWGIKGGGGCVSGPKRG